MTQDWEYEMVRNWWVHPESGLVIVDEAMPDELRPS